MDVVAHEFGHGVDDLTPGGISGGGTQEFVGDTFGAATEFFSNNPADAPDYLVGEEINLVGQGPIRNMYNPSAVGDPNCYSSSIPRHRGARGRRAGQPLVLPAGRGHQPDQRSADQPDLQRHDPDRRRHPDRPADHVQRDADEDLVVVVPEVPHLDADRGEEPRRDLRPLQQGQGRLERRQRAGPDRRPDLLHLGRRDGDQPGQQVRHGRHRDLVVHAVAPRAAPRRTPGRPPASRRASRSAPRPAPSRVRRPPRAPTT